MFYVVGVVVLIICLIGKGFIWCYEVIEGIYIYCYLLLFDVSGVFGYLFEYGVVLFWEMVFVWKIFLMCGFDVIQGCNLFDLIFVVVLLFCLFGVCYIFDYYDINFEFYEVKFGKCGVFWCLMCLFEWIIFKVVMVLIVINESYKVIVVECGGMRLEDVFVVCFGFDFVKLMWVLFELKWCNGWWYFVGYVGVMGEQEGIDLLIDVVEYIVCKFGCEDIQFVLVGGGLSFDVFQWLVESCGLVDYVIFIGCVFDVVLFEVLLSVDIGVNFDWVNVMNDKLMMNKIMEYMVFFLLIVQFEVIEGCFSVGEVLFYV